jgi:hypothetical protein
VTLTAQIEKLPESFRLLRTGPVVLLILTTALLASCKGNPSPDKVVSETKALGVYSLSGGQISEPLSGGQEEYRDPFNQTYGFKFTDPIPTAKADASFIVNLPNADVSESKLYTLQNPEAAVWHIDPAYQGKNPHPIKATIEPITSGIYKVTPSDEGSETGTYLCVEIDMPLGTPDRFYALQITK